MKLDDIVEVHYLGPEGTYSELATKRLVEQIGINAKLVPEVNYHKVSKAVNTDEGILGVLPLNKRVSGYVQPHYDTMYMEGLNIVGSHRLPLEFALGVHPESTNPNILKTHQQAYNSCCGYLSDTHPEIELITMSSTAAGIQDVVATKEGMALGHPDTLADNGLVVIDRDVDDMSRKGHGKDYTDFMLLSDNKSDIPDYNAEKKYESVIAFTPYDDRVGLLYGCLRILKKNKINLSALHTRPLLNKEGDELNHDRQMFYMITQDHIDSPNMQRALTAIQDKYGSNHGLHKLYDRILGRPVVNVQAVHPMGTYERLQRL